MMFNRTPDTRARDSQTGRIQENITNVEKHFGQMCQLFATYVRKTAKLRDGADLLVKEINLYADTETTNLKSGMKQFADHIAKIQDYRHAQVERLESKVVEPLKVYGSIVKSKREDLKTTQIARDREAKQMAQLERTKRRNPSDRQIIHQAESELHRATTDAARTSRQLKETIDDFEKQKIQDIKKIFGDFVKVEMCFHTKALELYTLAYQSIQSVDEEKDLEMFRSLLRPPEYVSRLDTVQADSKASLVHTGSFLGTLGTSQQQKAYSWQTRGQEEEEEDEDESEEEEDDEEVGEDTDDEK
ncbi:protein FAM92A isoform X2 [Thalassophryne amazonica]|uniref:protein FAM92A isoform X2 n=1 Tax=Thalassophryne amazonica TaxID=390379 RepID=UPI001471DE21|nr:protein FAM92A isoform X2 [Thalassophryne amazonica]